MNSKEIRKFADKLSLMARDYSVLNPISEKIDKLVVELHELARLIEADND